MKKTILFLSTFLIFCSQSFCMKRGQQLTPSPTASSSTTSALIAATSGASSSTPSPSANITSISSSATSSAALLTSSADHLSPDQGTSPANTTKNDKKSSSMTDLASSLPRGDSVAESMFPVEHPYRGLTERAVVALWRTGRTASDMCYGVENNIIQEMVVKKKFSEHDSKQCGSNNIYRLSCALEKLMENGRVDDLSELMKKAKQMTSWDGTETMIWDDLHPKLQSNIEEYIKQKIARAARKQQRSADLLLGSIKPLASSYNQLSQSPPASSSSSYLSSRDTSQSTNQTEESY